MIRAGLKWNGRLVRVSPNPCEGIGALCPSENHYILFNKRWLGKFFLAPSSSEFVNERFNSGFPNRSRWIYTLGLYHFTWHLKSVQKFRVITKSVLGEFQRSTRCRFRDTNLLSIKGYNNPKWHKDRGSQQFHGTRIASALSLSISSLFVIYFLWQKAFKEENQLYRVASCLSHNHDSKVYCHGNGKSMEDKTQASDIANSIHCLSHNSSQTQNTVRARFCGELQGKVDETDTLSFRQAVEKVDDLLEKRKVINSAHY